MIAPETAPTIVPTSAWRIERLSIAAAAALCLAMLQVEVPNGDGRVYIGLIEAGRFAWNPNHLLMQPIGLLWVRLLHAGWPTLPVFTALKLLSGLAALAAILIFHSALSPRPRGVRLLATAALFFSAHFLSMAIAEEFYMIQMPLVSAIFWLACRLIDGRAADARRLRMAAGALAAVATTISINNGLLAVALGPLLAISAPDRAGRSRIQLLLDVWVPGLVVGLPVFAAGYAASGVPHSALSWITAYQGDASYGGNALYGMEWSLRGLVVATVKLGYGFVNSLTLLAELGSVGEALLSSRPLEFTLNTRHLVAMVAVFGLALALLATLGLWLVRRGWRHPFARFAGGWLASYLVFNLVFSDTSDQFWFQLLPAFWGLFAVYASEAAPGPGRHRAAGRRTALLALLVPLLAVVNISTVAMPRAFTGTAANRQAFERVVRPGDLLVTTGWDDLVWLAPDASLGIDRVLLVEIALNRDRSEREMEALRARIDEALARGGRVIVARVFDVDHEGRPWEQLERLGWPRRRLQRLLGRYEATPIGSVDGVVLRQLTRRPAVVSERSEARQGEQDGR